MAAFYYWEASTVVSGIPSINLRFVWLALCVVMIAEVISRQSWGSKSK